VQGKTKLETNLQSASLLPHYNTFEARAMRVVISDLPPEFPDDEKNGALATTDELDVFTPGNDTTPDTMVGQAPRSGVDGQREVEVTIEPARATVQGGARKRRRHYDRSTPTIRVTGSSLKRPWKPTPVPDLRASSHRRVARSVCPHRTIWTR
jgi:hypothetical protein